MLKIDNFGINYRFPFDLYDYELISKNRMFFSCVITLMLYNLAQAVLFKKWKIWYGK